MTNFVNGAKNIGVCIKERGKNMGINIKTIFDLYEDNESEQKEENEQK